MTYPFESALAIGISFAILLILLCIDGMNDLVDSGFGSQSTDVTFNDDVVKPLWRLTPLKVDLPSSTPKSTLHSLCLDSISRNFHLYKPKDLSTIPSVLIQRVLHRVWQDRQYETEDFGRNPDAATIWAFGTLLDPSFDRRPQDHTLAIPQAATLSHLQPGDAGEEHPLIALPKLVTEIDAPGNMSFLTTMTLDGMDDAVNDATIVNLRYCTHLTVLWMRGCKVSDAGIRILAASLDLERGQGLCRLRAWYMPGCKGVSDRSMRALGRWPGLSVIDVRDTSVTTSGLELLNRSSRCYFDSKLPDYQLCPDGLRPIFSDRASPSDVLESLCLTLMTSPNERRGRWWTALHVIPSSQSVDRKLLPYKSVAVSRHRGCGSGGVYRVGMGMVYGPNVIAIPDSVREYRSNLKIALRIEDEEAGLSERQLPWMETVRTRPSDGGRKTKPFQQKSVKRNPGARSDASIEPPIRDSKESMLVRSVNKAWEDLRHAKTVGCVEKEPIITRRTRAGQGQGSLVGNILDTTRPARPISDLASSMPTSSELLRPFQSDAVKRRRFDSLDEQVSSRRGMKMFRAKPV